VEVPGWLYSNGTLPLWVRLRGWSCLQ
jgi:hypothetical protein